MMMNDKNDDDDDDEDEDEGSQKASSSLTPFPESALQKLLHEW